MGEPFAGDSLLGHDGATDITVDCNQYGEEWYVTDLKP